MRKFALICLMAALFIQPVICFGEETETKEEKQVTNTEEVKAFFDKFVGKWQFEEMYNDQPVISTVEFRRVLDDKFLEGKLVSKSKDEGKVVIEKKIYFNHNEFVNKIIFLSLESDGWIRQYIGDYEDNTVKLQGGSPQGMDFFTWKLVSDDEMAKSYYKPSTKFPDWDKPDKTYTVKRIK